MSKIINTKIFFIMAAFLLYLNQKYIKCIVHHFTHILPATGLSVFLLTWHLVFYVANSYIQVF